MSNNEGEAPLPRFRYHHQTGKWRREILRPPAPADLLRADETLSSEANSKPFESSYDYFLRCSYAKEKVVDRVGRLEHQRETSMAYIEKFQNRHLNRSDRDAGMGLAESSDDEEDDLFSEVDGAGALVLDTDDMLDDLSTVEKESMNPLMGYLSGVHLSDVYAALVKIKGPIISADGSLQQEVRVSRQEFHLLLSYLGDIKMLTEGYEQRMFSMLPSFESETVVAYNLYSYVVEHSYHPPLDRNVKMLFKAFDSEKRGRIPLEALHPRVIAAWAELNTFGNLRDQWLKLAGALQFDGELGHRILSAPPFLSSATVRALLSSSASVFKVVNSIDLDGGVKKRSHASS